MNDVFLDAANGQANENEEHLAEDNHQDLDNIINQDLIYYNSDDTAYEENYSSEDSIYEDYYLGYVFVFNFLLYFIKIHFVFLFLINQ